MRADLTIPEALLLLGLHDRTGRNLSSYLRLLIAGGALGEMALRGAIVRNPNKDDRYSWGEAGAVAALDDDLFLSRSREAILRKKLDRPARDVVSALSGGTDFLMPLYDTLVSRGALEREEKRFLFFSWTTYPTANPAAEDALKARLAHVLFAQGAVTERDSVTIALAKHGGLLPANFDRARLKEHRERIKEIAAGKRLAADATAAAIEAMQAALMTTLIMPAVIVN
ncbi:MAG: GPP34 family phosphoprotein [Pseudomonadota bacterium]